MRISKFSISEEKAKQKGLKGIDLTQKNLGSVVALFGKNGAGKSRILYFVENYLQNITIKELRDFHITNIPDRIHRNAAKAIQSYNKVTPNRNDLASILNNILEKLKTTGSEYLKLLNYEDLQKIKTTLDEQTHFNFEDLIRNDLTKQNVGTTNKRKIKNEFEALNSTTTINYFEKITTEIIKHQFNLFFNEKKDAETIKIEMPSNNSYNNFIIFQKYVDQFLGKTITYTQDKGSDQFKGVLLLNDRIFDIHSLSPGQKTLFAYAVLFFIIEVNSNFNIKESILIIDEPEKNLHPEAQIKLISALKNIIKDSGQLWIATHSINILAHLNVDEILMIKDEEVISPSRSTPGNSYLELMGISDHIDELNTFISSISDWAYANFMVQCFREPETILEINETDPQFKKLKNFLMNNQNISVLDFGAGKGRIGHAIYEDIQLSKKIKYSTLEPNPENTNYLQNVPNVVKNYLNIEEIENSQFDCIILCNVLHEINPLEWLNLFNQIEKKLKVSGFLLILEDKFLPKGENAHDFGYLILDSNQLDILFSQENLQEKYFTGIEDRIIFKAYQKSDFSVSNSSIYNAINKLKDDSYNKIKKIRKEPADLNQGRIYANFTQLYINSSLALESLTNQD